jgi:hypothetical protein
LPGFKFVGELQDVDILVSGGDKEMGKSLVTFHTSLKTQLRTTIVVIITVRFGEVKWYEKRTFTQRHFSRVPVGRMCPKALGYEKAKRSARRQQEGRYMTWK